MNELLPQDRLTSAPSTPRRPALHPAWRRVGKIVLRLLALLLLVLVVILGGAAAYGWLRYNQQVVLPQPTGKYAVGRAGFDWIDQNREESFSSDPAAKRELMVWVWYPVEAGSQGNLVQYLPDPWRIALERSRGFLAYFLTQNLAQVRPHALANVPLAAGQPSYPVLVMQPGLGPIATDYTSIAEELASHGYIVVASTPTYSSSMVVFADGREVDGSRAANVADNATPAEARSTLDHLVMIWAADNRFVLDQLTALNQGQLNQAQAG